MTEIERLQERIRTADGCKSRHVRSVPIHEMHAGRTIWQGVVEVFELQDHRTAELAYAWSYEGDDGRPVDTVVLGVPPINGPQDAVRAADVAEHRGRKR
jgi:hypothetical protein